MTKWTLNFIGKRAVTGLVIGFLIVNRSLAAVIPGLSADPQALSVNWGDVRDDLEGNNPHSAMRADTIDIVHNADLEGDLETAVRMSYALASRTEIGRLDQLWVDTLIARGNSDLLTQFLTLRSNIEADQDWASETESHYLDHWLWQARAGGEGGSS